MGTRVVHPVLGRGTLVPSEGEGFAVQYDGGALVEYPGQSIGSEHSRLMDRLDFGVALAALKGGQRVARAGWNGKGMWLGLVRGDGDPPEACSWSFTNGKWDNYSLASFIAMKTADDKFVPWLASQTDMLSEDWEIVGDG